MQGTPYYYDNGYWLNPLSWLQSNAYNNVATQPTNATNATNTINHTLPNYGHTTPIITNTLPSAKLIASVNPAFPLPTLSSSLMPEHRALPSLMQIYSQPMQENQGLFDIGYSDDMNTNIDTKMNAKTSLMIDNIAAPVDIRASYNIAMQNNPIQVNEYIKQK